MISERFALFLALRISIAALLGVLLWGLYRHRRHQVYFKYWALAWFSASFFQVVAFLQTHAWNLNTLAAISERKVLGTPDALLIAAVAWLFPAWMALAVWSLRAGPLGWRQVGAVVASGAASGMALQVLIAGSASSSFSEVRLFQLLRCFPNAAAMFAFGVLYHFQRVRQKTGRSWLIPIVCGLTGLHYLAAGLSYFQLPPYRDPDALIPSLAGLVLPSATAIALVHELLGDLTVSNRKLQMLWERALDPLRLVDDQGVIVQVNESFCQLVGKPESEVLGRPFTDCYSEESRDRILVQFRERVATQSVSPRFTRWMRLWNGKERCLELANATLTDLGRTLVLTAIRDTTAQHESEEALRRSEERLQMALDASSDCLFDWRLDTGDVLVTPRYYEMLGYEPYEFKATFEWWQAQVHPEDLDPMQKEFAENLGSRNRFTAEYRIRTKNGNYIWVEAQGKMVEWANGRAVRMLGTLSDVTARKQAEQERLHLEQQLNQSRKLEAIGRLAGGIAHDFNNLLTVITGYAQIALRSSEIPDAARTGLEQIELAAERAAGLTRQLLVFGRKQQADRQPLSLSTAVRESERMLRWMVGEDIKLFLDLEPDLPLITADRSQLQQVLLNLAGNARDAMPNGGALHMETRQVEARNRSWVRLIVRDTGVGMDEETKNRIFEPFFTTKEQDKGTGLGLATVYGVVQQSGGRIEVQSEPGRGTTFTIDLPATDAGGSQMATERPSPSGSRETVLVVEDEAAVRELTVECLRQLNYSVLSAKSAEEALALAQAWPDPIALLLTDVRMPGIKGPELAQRLQELRPGIRIMFMSGYPDTSNYEPQQSPFRQPYLRKPFTLNSLAEAVRNAIGAGARARHILVVDDEPGVRSLFRDVLSLAGYLVTEASSGGEALQVLQQSQVDLVVTDLAMPDSDGIELLMQLRSRSGTLPVVAVSGAFDGQFLEVSQRLGARRSLRKPIEPNKLVATVQELLSQP